MATSASDRPVPHRGQYHVTLSSRYSIPSSWSRFSAHHTLCTYRGLIVRYASSVSIQNPSRSVTRSKSSTCRVTDSRHRRMNSATPKASMSRFDLVPISFSTWTSTARPWQSHPPFRGTRWPVIVL